MVKLHKSDIRMTYECIRVTYGWHTSIHEWNTDNIRVHTSDIRMAYEYIRVTYEWHASIYEWHTITYKYIRVTYIWHTSTYDWHRNGTRVHIDKIRTHTSDIRITCTFIQVIYKSHTCDIRVHTIAIQMTCEWHKKY